MKNACRFLLCLGLSLFAVTLRAQDEPPQDAEGCKDSPLVSRFPGGHINSCENKEYEQSDLPMGSDKDGNPVTKHLEGEYHSWDIATRDGVSEIQVFRNFLGALENAGFAIDYTGAPDDIVAWLTPDGVANLRMV